MSAAEYDDRAHPGVALLRVLDLLEAGDELEDLRVRLLAAVDAVAEPDRRDVELELAAGGDEERALLEVPLDVAAAEVGELRLALRLLGELARVVAADARAAVVELAEHPVAVVDHDVGAALGVVLLDAGEDELLERTEVAAHRAGEEQAVAAAVPGAAVGLREPRLRPALPELLRLGLAA